MVDRSDQGVITTDAMLLALLLACHCHCLCGCQLPQRHLQTCCPPPPRLPFSHPRGSPARPDRIHARALRNLHNQLDIGVVVVVGAAGHLGEAKRGSRREKIRKWGVGRRYAHAGMRQCVRMHVQEGSGKEVRQPKTLPHRQHSCIS